MRFSFVRNVVAVAVLFCILCGMCAFDIKKGVAFGENPKIQLISTFSTYYGESSDNRKDNISLAASKINGTVLYPEDEFSFNDVVGVRSEDAGFKSAYIIKDGEFIEGVGGGVCQVSTTLYNAVLLADLTVSCVRPHSLAVSYVSPSFDAMVSSGSDFRFVNTLSAPVTIKMSANGKFVKCEIYGVKGRTVRRVSETIETIPYEIEYRIDETLKYGEEVVDSFGHNGLKSIGYLEYTDGHKVKIRQDTYAPAKRIILKGKQTEY